MTRKHYITVAGILNDNMNAVANGNESEEVFEMIEVIGRELAEAFKADNPRFDSNRFLTAAGIL